MKRSLLAALLCALLLALPTQAALPAGARVSIGVAPGTVKLGTHTKISGHVTSSGAALRDVRVELLVQRFPYRHSFRAVAARRTSATGGYAFRRTFDRNTRVRVRVSGGGPASRTAQAEVVPRTNLSSELSRDLRRLRVNLTARSPRDVRLGGRADIYLGRYGAKRLRRVSSPRMRPVSRGLARASVLLNLPASYNGGYRIVSCYAAPTSTGMREAGFSCPAVADAGSGSAAAASYRP